MIRDHVSPVSILSGAKVRFYSCLLYSYFLGLIRYAEALSNIYHYLPVLKALSKCVRARELLAFTNTLHDSLPQRSSEGPSRPIGHSRVGLTESKRTSDGG